LLRDSVEAHLLSGLGGVCKAKRQCGNTRWVGDYEACRVFSYLFPLAGESIGRLRRPFLEPD
jgi:hypothetical protein